MNHLLNYCRMTGSIKNVSLKVRTDNEHAIHMYEKLGFSKCGSYSDKIKIEDSYHDCIIMEMQI